MAVSTCSLPYIPHTPSSSGIHAITPNSGRNPTQSHFPHSTLILSITIRWHVSWLWILLWKLLAVILLSCIISFIMFLKWCCEYCELENWWCPSNEMDIPFQFCVEDVYCLWKTSAWANAHRPMGESFMCLHPGVAQERWLTPCLPQLVQTP